MPCEEQHLTDQDLVLAADGELSPKRAAVVQKHLGSCASCRARMRGFQRDLADFVRVHHQELDAQVPIISGPRALLRARLAGVADGLPSQMTFAARLFAFLRRPARYKLAVEVLSGTLLLAATLSIPGIWYRAGVGPIRQETDATPRPHITPGATVPLTREAICQARPENGAGIPVALSQRVFAEYGISHPQSDAYEIDHLITPELGGATTIRNLWPEPYYNTDWNARVKDQLEEHLHAMVCQGQIDLATAQHDLATNWILAYKKYFHTDRPLTGRARAQRS